MNMLVEIICTLSQESAQATIEEYFKQAGDRLIARCVYEEFDRVLLLIRLSPAAVESEHTAFLRIALQQGIVETYEYVICYLVSAYLDASANKLEQMRGFPLQPGESWFPAIDHPGKIYICIDDPLMTPDQAAWLIKHQVRWEYEDT
jgi:hypothetical protein